MWIEGRSGFVSFGWFEDYKRDAETAEFIAARLRESGFTEVEVKPQPPKGEHR